MKLIILDHFRRWWWVWLPVLIGIAALAWGICLASQHGQHGQFWSGVFPVGIWMGGFLLSFDLQRGHARVLRVMPVTARQLAHGWWWATVGIPAAAITAVTLLVFIIVSLYSSNWSAFQDCAMFCVASVFLLGTMFFILTELPVRQGEGNWPEQTRRLFFTGLWALSFGGWVFFQNIKPSTSTGTVILAITAVLAVIGWFRAEHLVMSGAGFRLGVVTGARKPGQHQAPAGYGGLPFLWRNAFTQLGNIALAVIAALLVVQVLMHGRLQLLSPKQFIGATLPAVSTLGYFFVFMFLVLPTIMQLRVLRTLPISTAKLAATLVLLPVVPVLGIGLGWAILNGSFYGSGFQIPSGIFWCAALIALGIPVCVGRGLKTNPFVVFMLFLMASVMGPVLFPSITIPPTIIALVSLGSIALAFELTRRLLRSSSEAYRPPPATMNAWGGWR